MLSQKNNSETMGVQPMLPKLFYFLYFNLISLQSKLRITDWKLDLELEIHTN